MRYGVCPEAEADGGRSAWGSTSRWSSACWDYRRGAAWCGCCGSVYGVVHDNSWRTGVSRGDAENWTYTGLFARNGSPAGLRGFDFNPPSVQRANSLSGTLEEPDRRICTRNCWLRTSGRQLSQSRPEVFLRLLREHALPVVESSHGYRQLSRRTGTLVGRFTRVERATAR